MPRCYKADPSGRRHKKIDQDDIKKAVDDVIRHNLSMRDAAVKHGIHYSNIYRAYKKRQNGENLKQKGGQPALTPNEEAEIVKNIERAASWGYPIDLSDFRLIVHMYLEQISKTVPQFKDNMPGRDFASSFLRRHKEKLSFRMCQNIKRSRAGISKKVINDYFDHLKRELEGVPATHIVNDDETNLSDDPGRKKILAKRGMKYPERVINSSKSAVSVMYAASASGMVL